MNRSHRTCRFFALAAGLLCFGALNLIAMRADAAPTLTSLYSFSNVASNADGGQSDAPLVQGKGGSFYGTTYYGGAGGSGTIFKISSTGSLTTLYSFSDDSTYTNSDGANPQGALVQGSDGNFYGTTSEGGTGYYGTVFKITPTGTFTALYNFGYSDGANPAAGLVQGSDGNFYGTTEFGGADGEGTVFEITPTGTLTTLYNFGYSDGAEPDAALLRGADGNFYGTTYSGGANGDGTVFEVTPTGTLTTLYSFTGGTDGRHPSIGALAQDADGDFYGATIIGGANGGGTIFKITPTGMLTTLHDFSSLDQRGINRGGAFCNGVLFGCDGNLYGTANEGGVFGYGTVFELTADGAFTTLVYFTGKHGDAPGAQPDNLVQGRGGDFYLPLTYGGASGNGTVLKVTPTGLITLLHEFGKFDSEGGPPSGTLVQGPDGDFYGATNEGGANGFGTVFKVSSTGALTPLHDFEDYGRDGANPAAGLILGSDGDFYGTTYSGGFYNQGIVFKIAPDGALTTLYIFSPRTNGINTDGAHPSAALVQGGDGDFYGMTSEGGVSGTGTVFKITPDGDLTTLYSFSDDSSGTNGDGANPNSALVLGSDGDFYGVAQYGGTSGSGTVFKITPAGAFTAITSFNGTDGSLPEASLVQGKDGAFYGTTLYGGSGGDGTIFKIEPSGTLRVLVNFNYNNGALPQSALIQDRNGNFYGTAQAGGLNGSGTIFAMTPTGQLTTLYSFSATDGSDNSDGAYPVAGLVQDAAGSFYGTTSGGGAWGAGTVFKLDPGLAPQITSFSPASGPVGSLVTITGTSLSDTIAARFHDADAQIASASSDGTSVTVVVPSGAQKGTITLTTPAGSATTATPFRITYAPIIASFTPTSGAAGTVVTITGAHLGGITRVRFHEADATVYASNADGTQLTVTVPSGAATGTITLDNRDALATTSNGVFTVTP